LLTLESTLEEWQTDCKIDEHNLVRSTVEIAKLHAKYLQVLSINKLQLKKAKMKQQTLLLEKWKYYNGKLSQDEIESHGWEYDPFNGIKVIKGDMNRYYDADVDIQISEEKIAYYKTFVETLTEIVENLKWKHQSIGNIIKWKQFEAGG
tara:strand:- start:5807 stop:6253 length:447 start_codon:yes stop_codon:yes gene_type:complete